MTLFNRTEGRLNLKKKDIILIIIILAAALLGWGGIRISRYMRIQEAVQSQKLAGSKPEIKSEEAETAGYAVPSERAAGEEAESETEPETILETESEMESETDRNRAVEKTAAEDGTKAVPASPQYGIRITVNGEEFGRYSLAEDQVININSTNTITVKDGAAVMTGAACPDHLCMYMAPIDGLYDLIVCLPNMVVVEGILMEGTSLEPEVDGIS